ncbi:hypothetical protein BOO69_03720 [Sulfitobacter alexandrii]|uniref:Lipoprotein n=1 Tax=Sulfitobacter alexandrii TaxID=1917485 RepID=A0A1J0WE84_9RHOB|nr:hypothetical protein [Sulfitobacter alexandrii]APE42626.1 hypothetical protein BOO69_03720 [Sulfitobacter alexandrii]
MKRLLTGLALIALVAGCAVDTSPDASPDAVAAAAFRAPGPKKLTVITMINNRTGKGGHTALLVNGSQQVIFDPAGSFREERVVERGDVIYGVSPGWLQAYKSAHARSTFHVVSQEMVVTPEQAETALRLVQSNGAVPGAYCTNATTSLLRQVPGFENIDVTFYPEKLMQQIAKRPGVVTTRYFEDDEGNVTDAIAAGFTVPQ